MEAVAYQPDAQILCVAFRTGQSYAYYGVPTWLYRALLDAQPHPWTAVGRLLRSHPVAGFSPDEPETSN